MNYHTEPAKIYSLFGMKGLDSRREEYREICVCLMMRTRTAILVKIRILNSKLVRSVNTASICNLNRDDVAREIVEVSRNNTEHPSVSVGTI